MSLFLDALSDAAAQMTETLASEAHAFGAGWVRGLEALLASPAVLFYLAAFAMVVFIMVVCAAPVALAISAADS